MGATPGEAWVEGEGGFRIGTAAPASYGRETSGGLIAQLSSRALRLAAAWPSEAWEDVAAALYFFNRIPATAAWRARLSDRSATAAFLGLADLARDPEFSATWRPVASDPEWRVWRRLGSAARSGRRYKLYVSPRPADMPRVMASAPSILAAAGADAFKVGGTAEGLLRPDAFVGYFATLAKTRWAAKAVAAAFAGTPARGVPFTVDAGADGFVSWGLDPRPGSLGARHGESWRLWICDRLARSVLAGRGGSRSPAEISAEALARLAADGVDPTTFRPHRDFDLRAEREAAALG